MTTATADLVTPTGGAKATPKFRLDIEGLRAIAVLFVVIWHAGVPFLPGGFVGVDVFFVISGFLMTGILFRELETYGRVKFRDFFARRVKRLLPASALAITVTVVAAWIILPTSRVVEIAYDAIASSLYFVNWRMADGSVDYFAQDLSASPLQHFWSLSVEEQFYIFWPLLLGVVGVLVGWGLVSARAGVVGALALIFSGSLLWSILYTATDPGRAYFVTTTRLWELALGGLVAVALVYRSTFPKALAATLSWLGLGAVIFAGFYFTTDMPFPGWIALVPTLGTAALIAFTPSAGSAGPGGVLSIGPMTWIGSISYSLYLWHWPVIILGAAVLTKATRDMTVTEGVVLACLSVIPAWLSLRYVENPVRRSEWTNESLTNTFFVGLVASTVPILVAGLLASNLRTAEVLAQAQSAPIAFTSVGGTNDDVDPVGAELLMPDPAASPAGEVRDSAESIYPAPSSAATSLPPHQRSGCHASIESAEFKLCKYGDLASDYTIMIAGDSHAAHWAAALAGVAKQNKWKFVVATKSTCPLNSASFTLPAVGDYVECSQWNERALEYLTGPDKPDVLLHTNSVYSANVEGGTQGFIDGGVEVIKRAEAAGVKTIALRDTPAAPVNVAECVAANLDSLSSCAFDREAALRASDQNQAEIVKRSGIDRIDLTDWICPRERCAPVIGGILVWRDSHHLTNEYSQTLAKPLAAELAKLGV